MISLVIMLSIFVVMVIWLCLLDRIGYELLKWSIMFILFIIFISLIIKC